MINRVQIWIIALVTALLIVVVLQNTQSVETKILFVTLSMPRAVLLFVTLLVGFVSGLLAATWRDRKGRPKADA